MAVGAGMSRATRHGGGCRGVGVGEVRISKLYPQNLHTRSRTTLLGGRKRAGNIVGIGRVRYSPVTCCCTTTATGGNASRHMVHGRSRGLIPPLGSIMLGIRVELGLQIGLITPTQQDACTRNATTGDDPHVSPQPSRAIPLLCDFETGLDTREYAERSCEFPQPFPCVSFTSAMAAP